MVSNIVVTSGGNPYFLVHRDIVCEIHLIPPPVQGDTMQLASWPMSGKAAERKSFQSKLQDSLLHHRDLRQTQTTIHAFTSGNAGHSRDRNLISGPKQVF